MPCKKRNAVRYISLLVFQLVALPFFLSAQQKITSPVKINLPKIEGFIENQGQLTNSDQDPVNKINFYCLQGSASIYSTTTKLSFVFSKKVLDSTNKDINGIRAKHNILTETGRMEMLFIGANQHSKVLTEEQSKVYVNSYLTNGMDGITRARVFKKITYRDIYPKIDLVLIYEENSLRYEFVVKPGGKVSDIKIRWTGTSGIKSIEKGGFVYQNTLGSITEEVPFSYTSEGKRVGSSSVVDDNEIRFETDKYDTSKTLTIDPTLTWATYYGGPGEEYADNASACNVATDTAGNVCVAYITESGTGIATSGAYQTTFTGNNSPFVVKFDSSGHLLWATYFGGTLTGSSEDNYGCNIAADISGNIFISGSTMDTLRIATNGAWQTKNAGGWDVFLAKFNPEGNLIWSTYYGGPSGEYGLGMKIGQNGDPFLAGWTFSSTGIATKGAFQTNNNGNGEAFAADFSSQGKLKWATYFGGTSQNEGMCIAVDNNGNIDLAGLTNSTGIATTSAYQTSYAGGFADAFLVQFDFNGARNWATYFGGPGYDYAIGLSADKNGNVFMTGYTNSSAEIASSGAHQTKLGGSANAFLAKFSGSGALDWSSYYGGNNLTEGTNLATDSCGFEYMTGFTESDTGIATSGGYQSTPSSSNSHAYLSKFSPDGELVYSTYYEGNGAETGFGIALDNKKDIYISGQTTSSSGIATSNGYQTNYGGNGDVFLAKFRQIPPFISAGIAQTIHCPGDSAILGSPAISKTEYSWTSKPPGFASNASNPVVKPKLTTTYYLRAYPYNDCPIYDSVIVTVIPFLSINPVKSRGICPGDSLKLGNSGFYGYSYSWTSNQTGFNSVSPDPYVSPTDSTYYYLTETNNTTGCILKDTELVFINPIPKPSTGSNQTICQGQNVQIGYTGAGGDKYSWASNPAGFKSGISNPIVSPFYTTTYTISETNISGCIASNSVRIVVNPIPSDPKMPKTDSICGGQPASLFFNPPKGAIYNWSSIPSGYSSTDSIISVSPKANTDYVLHEVFPATGCERQDTEKVIVIPVPTPSIRGDTVLCGEGSQIITYTVAYKQGDIYIWSAYDGTIRFGQGTTQPGITLNRYGIDTISLVEISQHGCYGVSTLKVTVNTLPQAGLIYKREACQFENISFKDSSSNTVRETIDFGDGSPVRILPSPFFGLSHTYLKSGNYIMTQVVYSDQGCPGGNYYKITIDSVPGLNWIIEADTGRSIIFNENDTEYASYAWNFGDGDSTHSKTGIHSYLRNGDYNLNLLVTSDKGCSVFFDSTIHINLIYSKNSVWAYPNPFTDEISLEYTLSENSHVTMELNDAIGRKLGNLFDEHQSNGKYNVSFGAIFQTLPPSVYFVKVLINNQVFIEKVVKTQ